MWHSVGCVAEPRKPTQTPGWPLRGMGVFGLASDEPTSIVGPDKFIGAVTQGL